MQFAALDCDELLSLAFQGVLTDVIAIVGGAHRKARQIVGEYRDLALLGVVTELVSVQGQSGFQAQRIPGAQTDGRRAESDQLLPQGNRVVAFREQFEAGGLAGVSRARDDDRVAFDADCAQPVSLALR